MSSTQKYLLIKERKNVLVRFDKLFKLFELEEYQVWSKIESFFLINIFLSIFKYFFIFNFSFILIMHENEETLKRKIMSYGINWLI